MARTFARRQMMLIAARIPVLPSGNMKVPGTSSPFARCAE
jgi:hypothetical protein